MSKASIVDLNAAAILVMVKGDPGIKKARLYRTARGKSLYETMVAKGLIVEQGGGCHLSMEGDMVLTHIHELFMIFDEEHLVEEHIAGMVEWYQGKTDVNRERNRRK